MCVSFDCGGMLMGLCATRRTRGNVYLFLLFSKTDLKISKFTQPLLKLEGGALRPCVCECSDIK